jgi:hypothetical protein
LKVALHPDDLANLPKGWQRRPTILQIQSIKTVQKQASHDLAWALLSTWYQPSSGSGKDQTMLSRNEAINGNKTAATRLDAAIIASLLAMSTLNLLALADQLGAGRAHAAAPCRCGTIAGVALA